MRVPAAYLSRTKALFPEFVEALKLCDQSRACADLRGAGAEYGRSVRERLGGRSAGAVAFDSFAEIAALSAPRGRAERPGDYHGRGNINEVGPMLIR